MEASTNERRSYTTVIGKQNAATRALGHMKASICEDSKAGVINGICKGVGDFMH